MPMPREREASRISADDFDAAIFDLDGVVTRTARVHAATWKRLFDDYLRERSARTGEPFREFTDEDYRRHVDGLPRYDGVAAFLASRGIELPRGDASDPPGRETVCGLGNRKNALFQQVLAEDGVEVFDTSVALIRRLRRAGIEDGAGLVQPERPRGAAEGGADRPLRRGRRRQRRRPAGAEGQAGSRHLPCRGGPARRRRPARGDGRRTR